MHNLDSLVYQKEMTLNKYIRETDQDPDEEVNSVEQVEKISNLNDESSS
jgi:hypothetical protein